MNLNDVKTLLSLRGVELLDFAAELVQKPKPSTLADPLTSPQPVLLDRAINDWGQAADGMSLRLEEFRQTVNLVLDAWEAPDTFLSYTSSVSDVMLAQQQVMRDVKTTLEAFQKALDDDKKAAQRKLEDAVIAIFGVLMGAGAGLVAGLLFPPAEGAIGPAVYTTVISLIGGIIVGLVAWLVAANRAAEDSGDNWKDQLDKLKALSGNETLRKIEPPRMPDLSNVKSFRLILE